MRIITDAAKEEAQFIKETLILIERTKIIYEKLAKLELDTETKTKTIDELRFAFFDMKPEKIQKSLAELNILMKKIQQQQIYYNYSYSLLLNHLPRLDQAFRTAAGYERQTQQSIYTNMRYFREVIEKLDLRSFNTMQKQPDNRKVCRETGLATEVERRFGDIKLAAKLKTQETGWGEEGKKKVLEIFDQRLKEIEKEFAEVLKNYEQGHRFMQDFSETLKRFEKLKGLVGEQTEIYSRISKENYLLTIQQLYEKFGEEAKIELQNMELANKRKSAVIELLKSVSLMEKGEAALKEKFYSSKVLAERHSKKLGLAIDIASFICAFLAPPVATVALAVPIIRKTGMFRKIFSLFKEGTKFSKAQIMARNVKDHVDRAAWIKTAKDIGKKVLEKTQKFLEGEQQTSVNTPLPQPAR